MATASKVKLSPSHRPVFAVSHLTQESADKASELLQENHEKHHIFFNEEGFHNHIVHHILTIYALGAPPSVLQAQYDANESYQLPPKPLHDDIVDAMPDEETFKQCLGTNDEYIDFLKFFEREIDKKGWQSVVNEYLFSRSERADDMLVRCFGGFLHPLIHLGFGIEFEQPAIIAEALAQTAVHDTWMGKLLLPAEELAARNAGQPSKTLMELMEEGRKNSKLVKSVRDSDGNKLREGVIARAAQEMIDLAAQYSVTPDELQKRCAEMFEFNSYITFAAQRPSKEPRIDFFLMHDLNCTIFFPRFLTDPSSTWLSPSNKARLLEWKARSDLAQYVARASPTLLRDEIKQYTPRHSSGSANGHVATNGAENAEAGTAQQQAWASVLSRITRINDDGHAAKLVRAVAAGEQYCAGAGGAPTTTVSPDMWLKMGQMALDSVTGPGADGERWVRSTGFESAWADVPERAARL